MDKLLRELNKQFKKHGISRIDQGAIVDASIVDSPYAPDGSVVNVNQKAFNRVISKTRCLIERTFGSIRRWFLGGRCRYRGLERTHTQNILEAMAYNLKRMPRLLVLQAGK